MGGIFSLIPEGWKIGVVAGGVVLVLGVIGALMVSRANLRAELAGARADVALCRNVNEDWVLKTAAANAAIHKMHEDIAKRAKVADQSVARVRGKAGRFEVRAGKILAAKAAGEACGAIEDLFKRYGGR